MRIIRRTGLLALLAAVAMLIAACDPAEEPDDVADADDPDEVEEEPDEDDEPDEEDDAADEDDDGEDYPTDAVDWIVPFAAGGGADAAHRVFQQYADELVDQPVNIVNIEGAGGVTGWTEFIQSEPDGYTLSLATPPFNILPALIQPDETPYDLADFQYICVYVNSPDAILVREDDDRFEDLDDLVAYAEENPGDLAAGMTGAAGTDMVHMLRFEDEAGVELTAVPFDSGADAARELVAGTVDVKFSDTSWIEEQPDLQALAVAHDEVHPNWPDVPTYVDFGYDIVSGRLRAPAAPPGTPDHVIDYWSGICEEMTEDEGFVEDLGQIGQVVEYMGPDEAREFIDDMEASFQEIVDAHEITPED